MRLVISLLSLLSAMGIMAQHFSARGDFKSDTDGKTISNAWMDLTITKDHEDRNVLSLVILPAKVSEVALVDTIWRPGSAYRIDADVKTDAYEERDVFFLYTFDKSEQLDTYYVFSYFVDTTQDDFTQVVVRKFAADGKRLWCMTADATNSRAKEFSKFLTDARKKLRFKKTTAIIIKSSRNKPKVGESDSDMIRNYFDRSDGFRGW